MSATPTPAVMAKKAAATRSAEVSIVSVTPAKAKEWLGTNEVNRNIRPRQVIAYRRDMENGNWMFTAEPIQISQSGRLLNGQHRLTALAGLEGTDVKSIDFVVATGLPDQTQTMMDQGIPRAAKDALLINHGDIKNVHIVASVCRWLVLAPEVSKDLTPNLLHTRVTTAESLAMFEEVGGMIERAAAEGVHLRSAVGGSPSAYAYSWFQLHRANPTQAAEFFAGMYDMEWAYAKDPRKAVLRRLQMMARDETIKANTETSVMSVSVITRGWNAWMAGEDLESINTRSRAGVILPVTLRKTRKKVS